MRHFPVGAPRGRHENWTCTSVNERFAVAPAWTHSASVWYHVGGENGSGMPPKLDGMKRRSNMNPFMGLILPHVGSDGTCRRRDDLVNAEVDPPDLAPGDQRLYGDRGGVPAGVQVGDLDDPERAL